MRFDGIQTSGQKFDYSAGVIKRKEEEDDPIRKSTNALSHLASQIGNLLAQGIMNPIGSDPNNGTSTSFRS